MSVSYTLAANFDSIIIGESTKSGHSATHSSHGSQHTSVRIMDSESFQATAVSHNSSHETGTDISSITNMTALADITISFPDQIVSSPEIPSKSSVDNLLANIVNDLSPPPPLSPTKNNFAPSTGYMLSVNSVNYSQLSNASSLSEFNFNNLSSSVKKGVSPSWSTTASSRIDYDGNGKNENHYSATSNEKVNFVLSTEFVDDGKNDEGLFVMTASSDGKQQSCFNNSTTSNLIASSDRIISGHNLAHASVADMEIAPAAVVAATTKQKLGHEMWTVPPCLEDGGLKKFAGRFAIFGHHGCYLSVRKIKSRTLLFGTVKTHPVFCDKTTCDEPAEQWIMYRVFRDNKWVAGFQNMLSKGFLSIIDNRSFLYAEPRANMRELYPWELFEVFSRPEDGLITLRSMKNGLFLCVVGPGKGKNTHLHGGEAICNRKAIGPWEQFTLFHIT